MKMASNSDWGFMQIKNKVVRLNSLTALLLSAIIMVGVYSCGGEKTNEVEIKETGNAALDAINKLIAKDSLDATLLFQRAELYYDNGYLDGSIKDLETAISIDSLKPEYFHLLADSYLDYYRSKEALLTMEKCVKINPKRIPSMLKLSELQLILKQYDESLQICSNILTINPQEAEAYFMMGMNLRSMTELERAKVAFRKATELNPELTDAWIILGQMYEDEGDPSAIEYYEAAINVDRDNPVPLHSKAFYLQNNDRIVEALDIYRQINVIDKDYLDAYLNAGIIYFSLDSLDKAYEQFDIMSKVKPQFYLSYYYRGLVHESRGDLDKAREDYNTSLKLNTKFDKAKKALFALDTLQNN